MPLWIEIFLDTWNIFDCLKHIEIYLQCRLLLSPKHICISSMSAVKKIHCDLYALFYVNIVSTVQILFVWWLRHHCNTPLPSPHSQTKNNSRLAAGLLESNLRGFVYFFVCFCFQHRLSKQYSVWSEACTVTIFAKLWDHDTLPVNMFLLCRCGEAAGIQLVPGDFWAHGRSAQPVGTAHWLLPAQPSHPGQDIV